MFIALYIVLLVILDVILIALGIAAGALTPCVSDAIFGLLTITLYNSCQRVLELVPTVRYSPSKTLKEPEILGDAAQNMVMNQRKFL